MIINTNVSAMNAHRQLGANQSQMQNSMEKLSSGMRINRAGDDAAGLAISEKMRAQVNGLDQASRNAQDGISMIQTAEGALGETHDILQRMRELAVQSSNDSNTDTDRNEIQKEMNELIDEIDRIGDNTSFNQKNLLDGNLTEGGEHGGLTFHIGANAGQKITLEINSMKSDAIGSAARDEVVEAGTEGDPDYVAPQDAVDAVTLQSLRSAEDGTGGGVTTQAGSDAAITVINDAIEAVSSERSKLGATQNRLDHTISNLNNASENLSAAESRIRDVDMAKEMMEMTKNNILSQASQSMLAQANQQPQSVLQLLG